MKMTVLNFYIMSEYKTQVQNCIYVHNQLSELLACECSI